MTVVDETGEQRVDTSRTPSEVGSRVDAIEIGPDLGSFPVLLRCYVEICARIIYSTENGLLASAIDGVALGKTLGFKGRHDTQEIAALAKLLTDDDVLYVLGAHVGELLIPLSRHCRQVVGYEASPEAFQYLEAGVQLNGIDNARANMTD